MPHPQPLTPSPKGTLHRYVRRVEQGGWWKNSIIGGGSSGTKTGLEGPFVIHECRISAGPFKEDVLLFVYSECQRATANKRIEFRAFGVIPVARVIALLGVAHRHAVLPRAFSGEERVVVTRLVKLPRAQFELRLGSTVEVVGKSRGVTRAVDRGVVRNVQIDKRGAINILPRAKKRLVI